MEQQKKDIYYKTHKYKTKYLALKQYFAQIGGAGACPIELQDPIADITSSKLDDIEKMLYFNGKTPVGLSSANFDQLENVDSNALWITPHNKYISYLEKEERHSRAKPSFNLKRFINNCGIFVHAPFVHTPFDLYRPSSVFRLHIMPSDLLIPISKTYPCAQILRIVLAGVKRQLRNLDNRLNMKNLFITKPYVVDGIGEQTDFKKTFTDIFDDIL